MHYEIQPLSKQLIFVRWFPQATSRSRPQSEYITEIAHLLNAATEPLYFLSDLRFGRITDVRLLQQLAKVTFHSSYGGSTAFSGSLLSELFVGVYSKFADPGEAENAFYKTLDQALGYLERIKPNITEGIDWQGIVRAMSA